MTMATVQCNDSFDHWWDPEGRKRIVLFRRSLRNSTRRYVENIPFIDGVPPNAADQFPAVLILAKAYVGLVKGELAQHNGRSEDALWTGLLFGPLFGQMWESANSLHLSGVKVPNTVRAFGPAKSQRESLTQQVEKARWLLDFVEQLPEYSIEEWIAQETLETADILAKAYVKAHIELAHVCQQQDATTIRHHAALLAEIVAAMLQLVLQGGERTDLKLPDGHLHKKIMAQQEKLRAPNAVKLWY